MMDTAHIQDIPQIKKLLVDIKRMKSFKDALPILRPLLNQFGIDTDKMSNALEGIDELERQIDELALIPDRFNDLFSERGWIMYDRFNMDVAKSAITKADKGDIDGAEADLVDHYSAETVRWKLQMMIGVIAFRPRMELAEKAFRDYVEGRYYASVLVVLALIDGLVSELSSARRGFSAAEVDLRAWDSMAGHSKGLNTLARVFHLSRQTLHTEEITIPYRNGIMHGMDTGYDNKMVAAKVWAALFAVREWALKVERKEHLPTPDASEDDPSEIFMLMQETVRDNQVMTKWKPRGLVPGVHIPASGVAVDYEEGTPERILIEFLQGWKARNFGQMSKYLPAQAKKQFGNELPRHIRHHYQTIPLQSYELLEFVADTVNTTIINAKLVYEIDGRNVECVYKFNILFEDENGKPSVRGKANHKWAIYNSYVHT